MGQVSRPYCPPYVPLAGYYGDLEYNAERTFRITKFAITEEEAKHQRTMSMFNLNQYGEYYDLAAGEYVRLSKVFPDETTELWMTDTPMEARTCLDVVQRAQGRVLIAGLGIGMVLLPILANPLVSEVGVIELEQGVIDLVDPLTRFKDCPGIGKLLVWQGDINTFTPERSERWDTIYFDVWPDISADNYENMKALKRKFRHHRRAYNQNPRAWMSCWRWEDTKRLDEDDRRYRIA